MNYVLLMAVLNSRHNLHRQTGRETDRFRQVHTGKETDRLPGSKAAAVTDRKAENIPPLN